ncbi:Alpha/Beta hydrolase protein [Pisolithus thermaeus]|nr:Alpha/Beta hydrolase protein [Pisolithus croceorrhizus]KAI6163589.1 Alpha/Beta hydrolase protein [Pisolithus thermaeus]
MSNCVRIDSNVNFFYEDSGMDGLDPSNYTTIVFIHGTGYNATVFRKLFPFGPNHNYRIVSLHRRGYAPSSPWTEEEVALFTSSDLEDGKKFLRLAGLQIARFLLGFAASQGIPKYDKEKDTGGIVLHGWSLGTLFSQAVLFALDGLTTEELGQLENYLHAVICHDPTAITHGIPQPRLPASSPWWQLTTVSEKWAFFKKFITGFYVHPNPYSHDLVDLNLDKSDESRPHSLSELPEQELEQILSFEMYATHDAAPFTTDLEAFRFANRRALFDVEMAKYLPDVRVRIVCGIEGSGLLLFFVNEMERALKDPSNVFGEGAERAREYKVVHLERGNHFVFWDEPGWALDQFITCLKD